MYLTWDCLQYIMLYHCRSRDSVRMSMTCKRLYKIFTPEIRALRTCNYSVQRINQWIRDTETHVEKSKEKHKTYTCTQHEYCLKGPCKYPYIIDYAHLCRKCKLIHDGEKCPLGRPKSVCPRCSKRAPYGAFATMICCKGYRKDFINNDLTNTSLDGIDFTGVDVSKVKIGHVRMSNYFIFNPNIKQFLFIDSTRYDGLTIILYEQNVSTFEYFNKTPEFIDHKSSILTFIERFVDSVIISPCFQESNLYWFFDNQKIPFMNINMYDEYGCKFINSANICLKRAMIGFNKLRNKL